MSVSAQQVKELRDKTGAGMMDCKKALAEANGDFEQAIDLLRKRGAAVAAKRAERSANEGIVLTKIIDNSTAVMVEVNCETDFVANSDDFVNFAKLVLDTIINERPATKEEILDKVSEKMNETTGKVGEKIEISRFVIEKAENGLIVDYIHHGSKLGVLIRFDNAGENIDTLKALGKDFAMQVAAMRPSYVNSEEVPQDEISKELEIYKELLRKEGKPEQMLEKIAQGKLTKYFQEVCLLNQVSVKDNSKSILDILNEYNKQNSADVKLKAFHRYHLSDENK